MFNILDSLKKLNITKKIDTPKLTILILMSGLILMIFPNAYKKKEFKPTKNERTEFIKKIENDLSQMISNVEGAGKSSVLVTLDEGEEIVYATENKKNDQELSEDGSGNLKRKINDSEKKYITVRDSNGNETPLIVKKIEPKVRGAIIACSGYDKPKVKENIIKIVSVALDISSNKIHVTKLKD